LKFKCHIYTAAEEKAKNACANVYPANRQPQQAYYNNVPAAQWQESTKDEK
jgi:hypothetical protein